ncbi:MAG: hypothetical protein R3A45_12490 [Bdellovibrionota bacterium]
MIPTTIVGSPDLTPKTFYETSIHKNLHAAKANHKGDKGHALIFAGHCNILVRQCYQV